MKRPNWLSQPSMGGAALLCALIAFAVFLVLMHRWSPSAAPAVAVSDPFRPPPLSIESSTSVDGRATCYKDRSSDGLSCIPTWMLDRPNNWLLYARPKKGAITP